MSWNVWTVGLMLMGIAVFVWAMWGIRDDLREGRERPPFVLPYIRGEGAVEVPRSTTHGLHRAGRARHRLPARIAFGDGRFGLR
ncbi:Uncharacterised protein [Nocardia otitidiscaviarum]|uniref:Uncharacterized protein n=1 Tax=Nocardia otitidiscaviarum TaxID=1823 RepID=A0A378X5Y2_9NOCA|nr:Uncharacterised protein [Nocardia otitidiscaviarum]